ncbi:MAG TPA: ABC transporter permease [Pyrinomonadaceae bacterium]|jgi:lipopolysaccharide transport system permease protein
MGATISNSTDALPSDVTASTAPPALKSSPQHSLTFSLPDKPLIVIEPNRTWSSHDLIDLWAYRELLYFLIWRDVKVRYKQAVLGVFWVVLQPLMTTLIFTIFLGYLARIPTSGIPYPLLVYAGILPWTFFSAAVITSGNSLVGNAHLITKVYFPRLIVPMAAVGARLVDFAIAFLILIGMMIYYHVPVGWNIVMLPGLIVLNTLLALGASFLLSAINVKYRDIGAALPVVIQFWVYVSPVLYPTSLVPPKWQSLYMLNPLVGIIEGFRSSILNLSFNWMALGISIAFTAAVLICSAYVFRRVEKSFADVI